MTPTCPSDHKVRASRAAKVRWRDGSKHLGNRKSRHVKPVRNHQKIHGRLLMFVCKLLMLETKQWRNPQYIIDPEILSLSCFLFFLGGSLVSETLPFKASYMSINHELPFRAKNIGDCLLLQLWLRWHHSPKKENMCSMKKCPIAHPILYLVGGFNPFERYFS